MAFRDQLKKVPLLTQAVRRARRFRHTLRRRSAVRAYFRENEIRGLHLGCGTHILSGWLNADLTPFDAGVALVNVRAPFPFPDASFDFVFSEHMIEHVEHQEALSMLSECHRVLKPAGRIRLSTPDLSVLVGIHGAAPSPEARDFMAQYASIWLPGGGSPTAATVINDVFYNFGHKFIYDEETLAAGLRDAGFRNVVKHAAGRTSSECFAGVDEHAGDYVGFVTFALEAER